MSMKNVLSCLCLFWVIHTEAVGWSFGRVDYSPEQRIYGHTPAPPNLFFEIQRRKQGDVVLLKTWYQRGLKIKDNYGNGDYRIWIQYKTREKE